MGQQAPSLNDRLTQQRWREVSTGEKAKIFMVKWGISLLGIGLCQAMLGHFGFVAQFFVTGYTFLSWVWLLVISLVPVFLSEDSLSPGHGNRGFEREIKGFGYELLRFVLFWGCTTGICEGALYLSARFVVWKFGTAYGYAKSDANKETQEAMYKWFQWIYVLTIPCLLILLSQVSRRLEARWRPSWLSTPRLLPTSPWLYRGVIGSLSYLGVVALLFFAKDIGERDKQTLGVGVETFCLLFALLSYLVHPAEHWLGKRLT